MPKETFNYEVLKQTPVTAQLVNAARTLNDDPGRHKAKALLAGGIATGGAIYGAQQMVKHFPEYARSASKPGILKALTSLAVPAGIYYAVKNRDSGKDIALGAGAAIGGAYARGKLGPQELIKKGPPPVKMLKPFALGGALPLAAATYMMDELGKAQIAKEPSSINTINKYPILKNVPHIDKIEYLQKLRQAKQSKQ